MKIQFPFNEDLETIFKLLQYKCKLVGGCVRDYLLYGVLVDDIDIATPLLPEEVMVLLQTKFNVIPTGLAHGTVTVFQGKKKYEITTLRKDIQTDGRHAVVTFNTTYEEDAKRRDFTINALYCDYFGEIYDYFDGLKDLEGTMIKFIGLPEDRIREDFLRILRFFRFTMRFGVMNDLGLKACYALKEGLKTISVERITQEWFSILSGKYFFKFFKEFQPIMEVMHLDCLNGVNFEKLSELGFTSVCLRSDSLLCLSNAQKKYVNHLKSTLLETQADASFIYNRFGKVFFQDKLIIEDKNFEMIEISNFPISGDEVLALGYQGKEVGCILKQLEYEWYAHCGNLSKDDLLTRIKK